MYIIIPMSYCKMRIIDGEEVYSTALAFRALTAAALAVFLSRFFRPSRFPFRRLAYACREIKNMSRPIPIKGKLFHHCIARPTPTSTHTEECAHVIVASHQALPT